MCFYIIHLQLLHQYGIPLFEVASSSKDALIVTHMYGNSEHCEVVWYSLEKMMYCIYKGKIFS